MVWLGLSYPSCIERDRGEAKEGKAEVFSHQFSEKNRKKRKKVQKGEGEKEKSGACVFSLISHTTFDAGRRGKKGGRIKRPGRSGRQGKEKKKKEYCVRFLLDPCARYEREKTQALGEG